ncbi:hypothetical protein NQ318_001502 [Aromia moschata]|uniref:HAT C-terminal dimerisation domain-containing protein n=1 Tax=Aromia moschata TaxID=1265417 RepID=A0AAV8Y7R8_9CUCU|nr:hypothetical protein NQ318_001502 [Aromia moschata]
MSHNIDRLINIDTILATYDTRDSVLVAEFKLWRRRCLEDPLKSRNAIDTYISCDQHIYIYPNIKTLLKIFATLPVSTCSAERSFSTLKRLKTYLRNTTSTNRLNGFALMNIHPEIPLTCGEIWIRYVDDIFAVFDTQAISLDNFVAKLNNRFPTIKFTYEMEHNEQLPFLDVLIIRNSENKLEFDVYIKETATLRYILNDSHHPFQYKMASFNFLNNSPFVKFAPQ